MPDIRSLDWRAQKQALSKLPQQGQTFTAVICMAQGCGAAEGVIHTAFIHDFSNYGAVVGKALGSLAERTGLNTGSCDIAVMALP
jgi:hypothetical protein